MPSCKGSAVCDRNFLAQGISASSDIVTLANEVVRQDLLGIMVWYASVVDGLQYDLSWDTSLDEDSQEAFLEARQTIEQGQKGRL